jgi:hypothetical protein
VSEPELNRDSANAAKIAFLTSAAFIVLLIALHVLRPDLDPSWRFISEYELGDYGWMMRLAFACLATSCLTLVIALWRDVSGAFGKLALGLVLLAAFGMTLAAVFVPDPVNRLHEVGAMLDHLPFAAPVINWRLSKQINWRSSKGILWLTAGLPLVGLIIFIGAMATMLPQNGGKPGPTVLVGWPNRIMILMHCAWIMPLAWIACSNSAKSRVCDIESF